MTGATIVLALVAFLVARAVYVLNSMAAAIKAEDAAGTPREEIPARATARLEAQSINQMSLGVGLAAAAGMVAIRGGR